MAEPSCRLLDSVHIDDDRQYIEFRFRDPGGELHPVQIDFDYVESLAAVFQQAFVSAMLVEQQGDTGRLGHELLAVPRVDIDHPVRVGVDVMRNQVVLMFLLGTPFQVSYALPTASAQKLTDDLLSACQQARQHSEPDPNQRPN